LIVNIDWVFNQAVFINSVKSCFLFMPFWVISY